MGLPEPSARQRPLKGIEAARRGRDKPESPPPYPLTPRTVPDQPQFPAERYVAESDIIKPRQRPADERSIVVLFNLSYQDLTTKQGHLFRQLGLHPGIDIDVHAAAALGNVERSVALNLLRYFHDLSLINEDPLVRDRFHDLLREYVCMLADADPPVERDAALERLLKYHLDTASNHAECAG
ncbi:MAG: hypothetical protein ACRDQ9_08155 [Pseudonocardiaceae bacterium]